MMAAWFTPPRLDLCGPSTLDTIRQAIDCLKLINVVHPADHDVVAIRGHIIDGCRSRSLHGTNLLANIDCLAAAD
jgi:hypothetical protein